MAAIQLEFNIDDKSPEELRFCNMEKHLGAMDESMGKVRRRLFAEMGELKKLCASIQQENTELKTLLDQLLERKNNWIYAEGELLFDLNTQ